MTLTETTKWILVSCILVANVSFFSLWLYFFCKDLRNMMALKMPKLFVFFCICCRKKNLPKEQKAVRKSERDTAMVNVIEDLESGKQLPLMG